jgi:hypothetical protein
MAQADYVVANGTGAAVRSDLNGQLAAIVSNNSGVTEPSTTYAYQWWADTTTGLLKIRNAANNAWITLFQLDGEWTTLALENGTAAAPSLYFKDSGTDTGLFSPGADQLAVATGGVERVEFGNTEVVFNDGGADVDFRVEGDTNADLFKIDAGLDQVQVANLNGGPLAGFRNVIINGNPTINQRGYVSGTATGGANQYTLDRWRVVTSGQNITFTDSANVRTVTAPAGGCEQVVEGASILSGTYTLNWTGTATATVGGSAVAKGGSVTLTGGTNVTVKFSSGTFTLVQLEPGPVATPFEQRPIGTELALCQRYYEVINYLPVGITYALNGDTRHFTSFATTKRVAPTMGGFPHSITIIASTYLGEQVNLNGTLESASSSVLGFHANIMGNSVNIGAAAGGGQVISWGDNSFRTVTANAEL